VTDSSPDDAQITISLDQLTLQGTLTAVRERIGAVVALRDDVAAPRIDGLTARCIQSASATGAESHRTRLCGAHLDSTRPIATQADRADRQPL
jgi:hypothetical protein